MFCLKPPKSFCLDVLTCAFTTHNLLWTFCFFNSLKSFASNTLQSTGFIVMMICFDSLPLAFLTSILTARIACTIARKLFDSLAADFHSLVCFTIFISVWLFHVATLFPALLTACRLFLGWSTVLGHQQESVSDSSCLLPWPVPCNACWAIWRVCCFAGTNF